MKEKKLPSDLKVLEIIKMHMGQLVKKFAEDLRKEGKSETEEEIETNLEAIKRLIVAPEKMKAKTLGHILE